jgi:beta-lactamase superfamily II metal-dependent hydrolase
MIGLLFSILFLLLHGEGLFASDVLEGCEHRTFQVGQGSCHSVLYSVKKTDDTFYKTLVFCDMGSSSRSAPTKLSFYDTSFGKRVFRDKDEKSLTQMSVQILPSTTSATKQKKKSETSSDTKMTVEHKEPFDVSNMTSEIEHALKEVDSFVVMLTHPDKDHINLYTDLLGKEKTKPILLICGGMWSEHQTEEVKKIWQNIGGKNNVQSVYPHLLDSVSQKNMDELHKNKGVIPTTELCSYHGSMCDLLDKYKGDFIRNKNYDYEAHFQLKKKKIAKKTFEELILKNIYLWSVKHLSDDTNAQSLVFSCTLPELKISFVFTGDATPETFKSIPENGADMLRKNYTGIPRADHTVCFVIPHHGAEGHYSEKACKLFKPDVILFSAGYVGNFNHPSKNTVEKYTDCLDVLWSNATTPFANKYKLDYPKYRVGLYNENKRKYTLRKPQDGKVALLGTNIFGSILINVKGMYSSGSNEEGYSMDLRQCIASCGAGKKILDTKGKIRLEYMIEKQSQIVKDIKFDTKLKKAGEYISQDKMYKLIKKSGGKQKTAKDCYYLCVKVSGK